MLKIDNLIAGYGPLEVLHGVSCTVATGEIVAILGINGAGKTTFMRALSGLIATRAGSIDIDGQSIAHRSPEQRVRAGIALAPEGRDLFGSLTVRENLIMGAYTRPKMREIEDDIAMVLSYFPRLKQKLVTPAASLSGGEGQMLAIGRALMSHPRLLLLDEPSHGLAPAIVEIVFDVIAQLNRERRLSILLVEQNARKALGLASTAFILQNGKISMQGTSAQLRDDRTVQELYLGG